MASRPAVSRVNLDKLIKQERERLDKHHDEIANVVGLGVNSGELRLRLGPKDSRPGRELVDGLQVESAIISRTRVPNAANKSVDVTYHAVVTGFSQSSSGMVPFHSNETFLHPMGALTWIEETVPDFDLYSTRLYDGCDIAEEDYCGLSQSASHSVF